MVGVFIGLTGKNCSGKDTIADVLEAKGFERHSLSDALRVELDRRGVERTRESLTALGDELRRAEGPGTLAERMKQLLKTERAVLVSIRNPAEVESFRTLDRFILLGVDAPVEVRFKREVARGREQNATTFEEFEQSEALQNSDDPTAQQLDACLEMADEIIINEGTIPELQGKVEAFLKKQER